MAFKLCRIKNFFLDYRCGDCKNPCEKNDSFIREIKSNRKIQVIAICQKNMYTFRVKIEKNTHDTPRTVYMKNIDKTGVDIDYF